MSRDWHNWRATAKQYGVEQADGELPDEWRKDYSFQERRAKWLVWWEQNKSKHTASVALP